MDTRIHIDRSSHCSLTEQLADGLRTAIYSGVWKESERIPTREQLVSDLGVSKNVVQAAISRLVAEGLLRSRPHIGCTVVRPSAQPMKGQVLELISGSETAYWNARFSSEFRRALAENRIGCSSVGVVYDRQNRFDPAQLEYVLSRRPDLILVKARGDRVAALQKLLDAKAIPYVLCMNASRGSHPQMLWNWQVAKETALDDFVADCRAANVHSVLRISSVDQSKHDPTAKLKAAGIAVEALATLGSAKLGDLELDDFMTRACDSVVRRLRKGPLCDLVFVTDDYVAMGVLSALLANGVRIPEDVRFVTYYNNGFGPVLPKSLARIERDYKEVGRLLAEGVVTWFKTGKFPPVTIPALKYVRGETFPVGRGFS